VSDEPEIKVERVPNYLIDEGMEARYHKIRRWLENTLTPEALERLDAAEREAADRFLFGSDNGSS
jgi:hypothetical protein